MTPEQVEQEWRERMPGWTDSEYADLAAIHIEVEKQRAEGREVIRVERQS